MKTLVTMCACLTMWGVGCADVEETGSLQSAADDRAGDVRLRCTLNVTAPADRIGALRVLMLGEEQRGVELHRAPAGSVNGNEPLEENADQAVDEMASDLVLARMETMRPYPSVAAITDQKDGIRIEDRDLAEVVVDGPVSHPLCAESENGLVGVSEIYFTFGLSYEPTLESPWTFQGTGRGCSYDSEPERNVAEDA